MKIPAIIIALALQLSPVLADEPLAVDKQPHAVITPAEPEKFQPLVPEATPEQAIYTPSFTPPSPKRPSKQIARKVGKFVFGAVYVTARAAAGFCQGYGNAYRNNNFYNNYNNTNTGSINTIGPNGVHGYSYSSIGNSTTVQQLY
jgi:hypothetical protein